MIPEAAVWAIFFIPLAAFVVIGLIIRPFFNRYRYVSSVVLIAGLAVCLVFAFWTLISVVDNHGGLGFAAYHWLSVGGIDIRMGLMVDQLTAIMLIVVVLVSLMVQCIPTATSGRPELCPVLRIHVPVHRFHDWTGAVIQHHPALRLLGACRPLVLPAYRILAPPACCCGCGQEGLHRDPAGRSRVPYSHTVPLLQRGGLFGSRSELP